MSTRAAAPALLVIGAALGSILASWGRLPILLYAPVERSFRLAPIGAPGGPLPQPTIEVTFYGVYLWALALGTVAAIAGALWDRRSPRPHPLLAAWALTALVVAAAYQIWMVWP